MGAYEKGIYIPAQGETGWDDEMAENLRRLGEIAFNVKSPTFTGADDGIKWNNARAALPASGGIVYVPPGSYTLTTAFTFGGQSNVTVLISAGVTLAGQALPAATGTNSYIDLRGGVLDATAIRQNGSSVVALNTLATLVSLAGLESARPAASLAGRFYFATDTVRMFRDTGSAWETVSTAPLGAAVANLFGTVTTGAGTMRFYNRFGRTLTITEVWAAVGTAPTGAALIVDVNKNGTTIFTTQSKRPQIAVSTFFDASDTPDVQTWAVGDYLTFDVDQIGSTVAGSDLVVGAVVTG